MSARTHRKPLEHNGTILPMTSERHCNGTRPWWSRWYTRRHSRIALLAVLALAFIALFRSLDGLALLEEVAPIIEDLAENHIFPPLYGQYHEQEMLLPQHNPDLPYPEGREGKYIWFPNHVHGASCHTPLGNAWINNYSFLTASGWGNAMQELLLNSYLAYGSGRAYVDGAYHTTLFADRMLHSVLCSTTTHGTEMVQIILTTMGNLSLREYRILFR